MTILAQRIRERRKALHLTQGDLANLTQISQAQISRYEQGDNEPTAEAFIALVKALNTTADWLLGMTDFIHPDVSDLTDIEREALGILRSKDSDQQRRVVEIIRLV